MKSLRTLWLLLAIPAVVRAAPARLSAPMDGFIGRYCVECHDADTQKGGLDLTALKFHPASPTNFAKWVTVFDRVDEGEMPPKKKARPEATDLEAFKGTLSKALLDAERKQVALEGRSVQRRLNRYEYENALRDLLGAPWLQIRDSLPEDGVSHRFNKVGTALDVSYVQMSRYLGVADYALRQVMARSVEQPETKVVRYYTRDQRSYTGPMKFDVFNTAPERATFPTMGFAGQPDVRAGTAPISVGVTNAELRELEGVGVAAGSYEPLEPKFNKFRAPAAGRYKLRFLGHSVWVGPGQSNKWFIPNLDDISKGRRSEPITVYSETPPHLLRKLGVFDVMPDPVVRELDVWLLAGETVRVDPARLFRSRPGAGRWQNPLAEKDGQPGVVFRWMEVEGPIFDEWPTAGHRLLFGDLPIRRGTGTNAAIEVVSTQWRKDAPKLLRNFLKAAYRRPDGEKEYKRFMPVIEAAMKSGSGFADAMIAGYTAVLCSPEFVQLREKPGRLDDYALATRLSFFLWNSPPDAELRAVAASGKLHEPDVLRAQTDRLLSDPKSRRFVEAFTDYWLDLRRIDATSPDASMYSDYYLDDLLTESSQEEPRAFFAELIREDLSSRNLVASDFAMLNERLAVHYGLPRFEGIAVRRVPLPADSVRGGLMTQAGVLKVTANGSTTSPVLRGAWIMERILGKAPPPPPPNIPAVEPDIRGAVTIRQQLEKHRSQESCAACHRKMDPAGFALEAFDVMGGARTRYRALGPGTPEKGIGMGGQKFEFHYGPEVDATGELPDGRKFHDVRELKALLLEDDKQVARNLARQLAVYATGSPVRFADRPEVEQLLVRASSSHYGVRSLIHELVQSRIFQNK
jgi:hypothetical protein